jgi:hypothetical protein
MDKEEERAEPITFCDLRRSANPTPYLVGSRSGAPHAWLRGLSASIPARNRELARPYLARGADTKNAPATKAGPARAILRARDPLSRNLTRSIAIIELDVHGLNVAI